MLNLIAGDRAAEGCGLGLDGGNLVSGDSDGLSLCTGFEFQAKHFELRTSRLELKPWGCANCCIELVVRACSCALRAKYIAPRTAGRCTLLLSTELPSSQGHSHSVRGN